MTPEERDLLSRFLDDLARSRPQAKDAEAAAQIDASLRANPDAAYVLVQHAILADHALQDAQAHIAELEQQLGSGGAQPLQAQASFLGSLFNRSAPPNPPGVGQAGPWGERGGSAVPPTPQAQPGYGPGPGSGYDAPPPPGGPFSGGGGLGGFLRNAGQTAAGVAGGAFLFEGLQGLFGGHRGGGFGGGYGFAGAPPETVTINEYGDDRGGGGGFDDSPRYDSDDGDPTGDDYS